MRRPRTRADRSVRRPTTAPIMSRGPPVVNFSGRTRWRMRPTAPPAKTATPTRNANLSGLIDLPQPPASARVIGCAIGRQQELQLLSPPLAHAGVDEIVHLARHHPDVEQPLDPLAPGAGEIGAPVGRVDEGAESRSEARGVIRVDRDRAGTAHFGEPAQA